MWVTQWLQRACPCIIHLTRLRSIPNYCETTRCAYAETMAKALELSARLDDHHAATLRGKKLRLLLVRNLRLLSYIHVCGLLGQASHTLDIALADLHRIRWIHSVRILVHRIQLLLHYFYLATTGLWVLLIEMVDGIVGDLLHELCLLLAAWAIAHIRRV